MNDRINADDIVITGGGVATCLGADRWTTWREVLAGRCGVRQMSALESTGPHPCTGGQAVDLPDVDHASSSRSNEPREIRYLKHVVRAALDDARLATDHSQLHPHYAPARCAAVMGTTLHGMRNGGAFLRSGRFEHLKDFLANSTLQQAVHDHAVGGPRITTCSACSSGLASVILGIRMLQTGQADLVLAGGYDPISEYAYAGFRSMRLESESGVRPFSRRRDGMKVAEGYACLVLERADAALRRDATILARIIGYGEACDAFHLSKPHPQGNGAAEAMRSALMRAGIEPDRVNLIVAHATATHENDAAEYAAIRQVFGAALSSVPASAFKSHLGHTLGGAGAVELVLSAMALGEGVVPPCVGVDADDLEFDLPLQTRIPLRRALRHTLNLSLGFGGANACIILAGSDPDMSSSDRPLGMASSQRARTMENMKGPEPDGSIKRNRSNCRNESRISADSLNRDVLITGVGVILPGAVGNEALVNRLSLLPEAERTRGLENRAELASDLTPNDVRHGTAADLVTEPSDEEMAPLVNAQRARRMSRYARLCIAATTAAYRDAGISDPDEFGARCAVFAASLHGPAGFCEAYYRQIIAEGLEAANPSLFAEGVPNVGSAHLSTHFRVKGFCQSIIGTRTAGLDALHQAATSIRSGACDRVVVCAADETTPLVAEVYARLAVQPRWRNQSSAHSTRPLAEADRRSTSVQRGTGAVCLILESATAAEARGACPRGVVLSAAGVSWPTDDKRAVMERIAQLWDRLGSPDGLLLGSAGTDWSDRMIRAGLQWWARRNRAESGFTPLPVSTLYGHFPDVFSALPLAELAATLLCGRLPVNLCPALDQIGGFCGADGNERIREVGLLTADAATTASGARVRLISRH